MKRLEMKNCNTILAEKQQKYQHYIVTWKNDKYEQLTDEVILLSNQRQIIEQAKFMYSPLEKGFVKQTKND